MDTHYAQYLPGLGYQERHSALWGRRSLSQGPTFLFGVDPGALCGRGGVDPNRRFYRDDGEPSILLVAIPSE